MNRGVPQAKVDQAKDIAGDGTLDERCRRLLDHYGWFAKPEPTEEPEPVPDEPMSRELAYRSWERQLRHASEPCAHVCETCRKAS